MTKSHTPGPWIPDFTKHQLIAFLNGLPGFQSWPAWEIERHMNIHGLDYFRDPCPVRKAAPELLDALDAVLGCSGMALPVEISQAAKAAIAKTRGETK